MKDKDILNIILEKEINIAEDIATMKEKIASIEVHSAVSNDELGKCLEDVRVLKNKLIMRLGWKDVAKIAGITSTIFTIVYTLLKIFVFRGA